MTSAPPVFNAPQPLKKVNYKIVPFGAGVSPNAAHCAALHSELLPRSPLTKLGSGFMERFYYKILPKQGYIFGAIAYVDGHPAGFIAATYDSDGFLRRSVRHNLFRLAFLAITMFPTPRRIEGGIEALGIFHTRESKGQEDSDLTGEVLSIGVRKSFRSSDFKITTGIEIAQDLMHGAMDGFRRSNLNRVRLIVDANDIPTQGFYTRLGWRPRRRSVPGWLTPSTEFVWTPQKQN